MDFLGRKQCTVCDDYKKIEKFDISPRTGKPYPRCQVCRLKCRKISTKKQKALIKREQQKRRCVICGIRFMPILDYQKCCSVPCDIKWQNLRPTLQALAPKEIILNGGFTAIVDADDYEYLKQFEWHLAKSETKGNIIIRYAVRLIGWANHIKMEHEIMEPKNGEQIDHINHNGLNNRKTNLRICTQSQNMMNKRKSCGCSSQFKGVTWNKQTRRWKAYISPHGKYKHLGLFDNEIEAAKAYDEAAKELFGEFACLNFPEEIIELEEITI